MIDSPPSPPRHASTPRRALAVAAAIIVGFGSGVAVAWLIDAVVR
ncbi:MAG: hypothetical protein ACLGHM_09070 [Actinomycetes bacterium]